MRLGLSGGRDQALVDEVLHRRLRFDRHDSRDGPAVLGDRHLLTGLHTFEKGSEIAPELANADRHSHDDSVQDLALKVSTKDAPRTLSLRELNRALLARQLLLQRTRLPVVSAIERIGGLQAQWPPAPYIALWSRLAGFRRSQLETALARRRAVKATLMRLTLHIVSAGDYAAFVAAFRGPRVEGMLKQLPPELHVENVPAAARRLAALVAERPRTRSEVFGYASAFVPLREEGVIAWQAWSALQAHGGLVHAPHSGFWRTSGSPTYEVAREPPGDPEDGLNRLVTRYLAAFGPATRADIASWAGLPVAHLAQALERLPLRTFRDDRGRTLLDVPRAPLPAPDTPAPVRFLAKWDSPLLAYEATRRDRILPEQYRKTVIQKNGDVVPTFLVDGFVAGRWRTERARKGATLVLEPFEPLPRKVRQELEVEGARLLGFVEPDGPAYTVTHV